MYNSNAVVVVVVDVVHVAVGGARRAQRQGERPEDADQRAAVSEVEQPERPRPRHRLPVLQQPEEAQLQEEGDDAAGHEPPIAARHDEEDDGAGQPAEIEQPDHRRLAQQLEQPLGEQPGERVFPPPRRLPRRSARRRYDERNTLQPDTERRWWRDERDAGGPKSVAFATRPRTSPT